MSKWWLLLAALALWLAWGYVMLEPQQTNVSPLVPGEHRALRIVSMAPNLTEILFALGLDARVAGVTTDSDYPPCAGDRPKVGSFWQPNIEAVIATRPDLVVTLSFEQQSDVARRLRRIGYDCLTVDIEKIEDLFTAIVAIGNATGTERQAERLCDSIETGMRRFQAVTAGLPRVRVLWVVQREPLRAAGPDTFINEMIELAGGENVIGPTLQTYPPVGVEQVIAAAPEVIIEPAMVQGVLDQQRRQAISYWRRYGNVPAVSGERICVIDGDVVSRLGPRLPEGVEAIARCLRPELFGE